MNIELNKEQQFAFDALVANKSVYLCGSAGTGKSIVIRAYLDSISIEEKNRTMIVAPTGIAALNIGGVTIHRAFSAPIGPIGPNEPIKENAVNKVRAVNRIIIDEISMCRFDLFNYVSRIIKRAEELEHRKIPLIVVGDFLQLPPVVKESDVKMLGELWPDLSSEQIKEGYASLTEEWKQHHFINIRLTQVMRQRDKNFINFFNRMFKPLYQI